MQLSLTGSVAGAVACDEKRKVVGLWIFKIKAKDSMVAESFAIFKALEIARIKGWNRFVCESDVQSIVKTLFETFSYNNWECEGFIEDIRNISFLFEFCNFLRIPRSTNL